MRKLLKHFGADERESDTYVALLALGAQPVSVIAKHVGSPRPTMYLVLERLIKARLVKKFKRAGVTYVQAVPPRELKKIISKKEKEIEELYDLYEQHLPRLEEIQNHIGVKPTMTFEDKDVMKVYEDILKENHFCAYFDPETAKEFIGEYYYGLGDNLKKKGGTARELVVDTEEGRKYWERFNSEKHQIRLLPKNVKFHSDTLITSDRVYMVAYEQAMITATEMRSSILAQTQQAVFDMIWELGK